MIVTESDRDTKSVPPSNGSMSPSTSQPPPAYHPVSESAATPSSPLLANNPANHKPLQNERAWRRFLKAFCVAVAIYLLLGMLIKSFLILAERHLVSGVPSGPLKGDGRIVSCANQTWDLSEKQFPNIPPYASTSSFFIPVSSSHIFLFSRGSYGHGTIKMELSTRTDDQVEIEVITRYHSLETRNRANLCHLARDKDGQGVGIFTPRRLYPNFPRESDNITFDVTIRFPRSGSAKNPLIINSLETTMGIWSHTIASLENRVNFTSLSLTGSNAHIRAESISGAFVQLTTENGPITGSYNVSNSLNLKTSNAAIKVTLRMENEDSHKATSVIMKTSNARIESPITLVSTDKTSTPSPSAFSVTAKTSNGPVTLWFPDAPSSSFSHLNLNAKTSNAAASTVLHATYEGSIFLKTSNFIPSLVQRTTPADPSGKGRHRNLELRRVLRGALEAGVWWGDDSNKDEGKGTVIVTTSNAQNKIELS